MGPETFQNIDRDRLIDSILGWQEFRPLAGDYPFDSERRLADRLRLVVHPPEQWIARRLELLDDPMVGPDDLRDAARGGWARACKRYSPARGTFPNFAKTCITSAIRDELRRLGAPRKKRKRTRPRFKQFDERLTMPGPGFWNPPPGDVLNLFLMWALDLLTERDATIIAARYHLDGGGGSRGRLRTYAEIAELAGITEAAARQSVNRAIDRVRQHADYLRDLADDFGLSLDQVFKPYTRTDDRQRAKGVKLNGENGIDPLLRLREDGRN